MTLCRIGEVCPRLGCWLECVSTVGTQRRAWKGEIGARGVMVCAKSCPLIFQLPCPFSYLHDLQSLCRSKETYCGARTIMEGYYGGFPLQSFLFCLFPAGKAHLFLAQLCQQEGKDKARLYLNNNYHHHPLCVQKWSVGRSVDRSVVPLIQNYRQYFNIK